MPDEYTNTEKSRARLRSIVVPYLDHFGFLAFPIPNNRQYWTLCARHHDDQYQLLPSSELSQMLSLPFLKPGQFHGVDRDPEIIAGNQRAVPEANWHCEDFYQALVTAKVQGNFNPAIVNFDSVSMPKQGCAYLSKLLWLLRDTDELLFVANLVLKTHARKSSFKETVVNLLESKQFRWAFADGWKFDTAYQYNGSGRDTVMGSLIFWRD